MMDEGVLEYYNYCRGKYGPNDLPMRHGWPSGDGQNTRFQIIMGLLVDNLEDLSVPILDFGCGTGELFVHMHRAGIGSHYIGVDGIQANIDDAHRLLGGFPGSYELHRLFWDGKAGLPFDTPVPVVVESGAFGTIPRDARGPLLQDLLGITGDTFVGNFFKIPPAYKGRATHDPLDWNELEVMNLVDREVFEGRTYFGYSPDDFTVWLKRR